MTATDQVLISLENRHSENIFSTSKKVEFRRRPMNVSPGAVVWLYVKVPVGAVVGSVLVSSVHNLAAETLWRRFGQVSGLSKHELLEYLSGVQKGFALELTNARRLAKPISLAELRRMAPGFHPPQFFINISKQHALHNFLIRR